MSEGLSVVDTVVSTIYQLAVEFGSKIIACLVVYFIGSRIIRAVCRKLESAKFLSKTDDNVKTVTMTVVKVALWAILIISITSILGIETSSLIALVTSLGVTVGLALQGTMSNVASGIMIYVLKPFRIGDYVDAGGASGTVTKLSLFHTYINTVDAKVIMIPNSSITGGNVVNYSTSGKRRVDLDFNVDYGADSEKVKSVMLATAAAHSKILSDPAPFARITKQDSSALVYTLRVWVNNADYWDVYFDMIEQMKAAFDREGIKIPYSQLDVHVSQKN